MRKIISIVAAFVLVGGVIVLSLDSKVSISAASFMQEAIYEGDSPGYVYLMGIEASEGDDPVAAGRQIIKKNMEANEAYFAGDGEYQNYRIVQDQRLASIQEPYGCFLGEEACMDLLLIKDDYLSLAKVHRTLIQRYKSFKQFDHFRIMLRPSIYAGFPPYHYLSDANKLQLMQAIHLAKRDNLAGALHLLFDELAFARKQMALQDNMIGKLIFLNMASTSLDVIAALQIEYGFQNTDDELPALSVEERHHYQTFAREFATFYSVPIIENNFEEGDFATILLKLFYKRNRTINQAHLYYKKYAKASLLDTDSFVEFLGNDTQDIDSDWLLNPVGTYLLKQSQINLSAYIARMHDFNAKMAIYNALLRAEKAGKALDFSHAIINEDVFENFVNPYGEEYGNPYLSASSKMLCVGGPFDEEKNLRCLRICVSCSK